MLSDCYITAMLPTKMPEAAKDFYSEVLGLKLVSEDQFAVTFQTPGGPLRLQKVAAFTPHPFSVLGWNVPDVGTAAKALAQKGVRFELFEGMEQDELGVWRPPGGSKGVCWFKDPDGHLLSLS